MLEKFKFILYVVKRLLKAGVGERADISGILQLSLRNYHEEFYDETWLPISNSSGGMRIKTIERALNESKANDKWLFVSEPTYIKDVVGRYILNSRKLDVLEELLQIEWQDSQFNYDLCSGSLDLSTLAGQYEVVISQSLLEHVVDPVQVIRNMSKPLKEDGILIIQTHNRLMNEHHYPIDTLRFNEDFFLNLEPYTNLTCLDVVNSGNVITAVLRLNRAQK
jgi:SAM-dependent methyltransferase